MTYQINIVTFHYVFSNKYRLFKPQRGLRGFLISQRINNPLPLFVTTSRCISDFPTPNLTPNPRIFLQPDYRNTPSRDPKQHNPSHKWISQPTRQAFPCDKIANNNIGTTKERDGGETKWQERERERELVLHETGATFWMLHPISAANGNRRERGSRQYQHGPLLANPTNFLRPDLIVTLRRVYRQWGRPAF